VFADSDLEYLLGDGRLARIGKEGTPHVVPLWGSTPATSAATARCGPRRWFARQLHRLTHIVI